MGWKAVCKECGERGNFVNNSEKKPSTQPMLGTPCRNTPSKKHNLVWEKV
ncbi:MAG: hypothetical protein FWC91_08045 [Defluviitaleaceae bacterium]|nr:hypothetical protein [Defluviitaleaceae bacterium]